jgi:hypothetical protein
MRRAGPIRPVFRDARSPRISMQARPRLWLHLLPSQDRPWLFGGD